MTMGETILVAGILALGLLGIAGAIIYCRRHTKTATAADVETLRSTTGLLALVAGDVVILAVAVVAAYKLTSDAQVAIFSGAFSAVTAITASYFSIRAASNTAAKAMETLEEGSRSKQK
ncbi:hypothetical protein WKI68_27875 [Streptomyces sp. MS1.HAVA.3]|uniref:Uncharacterized protein n=1 Tax=Streptomyces caledonius TaxID=3134107 RepID=A0ABU8U893_9ACTN